MRDQRNGRVLLLLQLGHQIQNFRLNSHIQRSCGFVRDQQFRRTQHCHRDHHALTHPARQLMRILVDAMLRFGNPDTFQPIEAKGLCRRTAHGLMCVQNLSHLLANRQVWRQRRQRILKDHRHIRTADFVRLGNRHIQHLLPVEHGGPTGPPVLGQKPHDGHHGLAFARSTFAHNAKAFAGFDRQVDPFDRVHLTIICVEGNRQVLYIEQCHISGPSDQGRHADRRRQRRRRRSSQ